MKAQCAAPARKKVRWPLCPARGAIALREAALGKVPFFGFVFWASKKGTGAAKRIKSSIGEKLIQNSR